MNSFKFQQSHRTKVLHSFQLWEQYIQEARSNVNLIQFNGYTNRFIFPYTSTQFMSWNGELL